MRKVLATLLALLAVIALVVTLASLIPSDFWLVRTVDLVREPFIYLALLLALLSLFVAKGRWWLVGAFLLVAAIHLIRIWPYVFAAPTELALDDQTRGAQCATALAVNVKVKNTDYAGVRAQIAKVDPDILLLMETDGKWANALQDVVSAYPVTRQDIQPEAFGMIFATRLPAQKVNLIKNTHRDTPTLYATLRMPDAGMFEFIGLHPKPPLPGWDTNERDQNIINAGVQTPDRLPHAVVMGDFNDVPWSRTTTRFREQGDWRDPRIGRGTYPTFPADLTMLGWPLDQMMVKGDMHVRSFAVMPDNGSDHRAMRAQLCLSQAAP